VFAMYGAMLAGVDGIVVGAGNPDGLPEACACLSEQKTVSMDLSVMYREAGETFQISFNPCLVAGGKLAQKPLCRRRSWQLCRWKIWLWRWLKSEQAAGWAHY